MTMRFFDKLSGVNQPRNIPPMPQQQPTQEQMKQIRQSVNGVRSDPAGFLRERFGVSIQGGMTDPTQILNHLAQSGQLNGEQMQRFQQAQAMMGQMAGRR